VAVSLITGTEEVKTVHDIVSDCEFLRSLFRNEFVFDQDQGLREEVNEALDYFLALYYVAPNGNATGYKLTKLGFDCLPIWAALMKTFLESYWIATRSLLDGRDRTKKKADLLKSMNYLGLRFHKLGVIDHLEAVSRINFENALHFIHDEIVKEHELSGEDPSEGIRGLSDLSQRLYQLCHFKV
jgi:glycerol-3-phosphate O-acyltransferase